MNVLVVGGGVIGLSVAWELAGRGRQVRLVERARVGAGASGAAAGILPPACLATARDPIDRLRGHSHQLYPHWVAGIGRASRIDVGLRRCGGFYLASTAGEAASVAAAVAYWHELGISASIVSRDELKRRLPALAHWADSPRFRAAAWVDDEWQVRPAELVKALLSACRSAGVRVDEMVEGRLERHGDRADFCVERIGQPDPRPAERTANKSKPDAIVLCGGAWTGVAARDFGLELSVVPIRGQMLRYQLAAPPFHSIVNEGHRYFVPREDGSLLIGSCEEEVGFEPGTTPEMLTMLRDWAVGMLPELADREPNDSWSGLRPAAFDGFPILGAMPEVSNLFVAYGHFRSGIHLAPATAERIADLIEGREPQLDLPELDAARARNTGSEIA
ncbi:MAG: glycine oxidase ThiO [Planctomycetaceae bacterium]|nr:MAG: glycine oxidase ThiO [Planctomycetaceae bacterium]